MSFHVVIVGAGMSGLACALACAQAGARVDVLETRDAVEPLSMHVDLVPSLLRDLARLGVADACVQRGFAYSQFAVVDENGDESLLVPARGLAGPRLPPAVGIARDDLLELLAGAAVRCGAVLHRGCTAWAVDVSCGRVATEGPVFEADLIVLATGAESPLADAVFGPAPGPAARHAWWHALLPRPPWLECSTWMAGSVGRRLMLVPVGISRAGIAVAGAPAPHEPADGQALVRLLKSWGPLPRRVAELMEPSAPTVLRRFTSALREAPWHRGAALCVGAAAHAVAPAFGQTVAQALEDAVVLGELVATGLEHPVLQQRFMARRGARAERLHTLTERAAHWMLHPEPATDLMQIFGEIRALVEQPA